MRTLVMLMMLAASMAAWSGTTLGVYEDPRTGKVDAIDVCVTKSLDKHYGAFVYLYVSPKWSEGYGGGLLSPNEHWQFAIGPGLESGQSGRYGGWIWYGNGKISATYAFEGAGSGYWDKWLCEYKLTPDLTLGPIEKRGKGWGGTADWEFADGVVLRAQYFPAQDGKKEYVQVGVRFKL